ncbi:helix-turn-helix transcriptional regulator [Pseudomonas sp. B21-040]|uniref:helix-turn-helix domain-containing protein n=1 Tax=Pseudomonas sp. B21-040 TaxID=2895486 RepID=UPI00215FAD70|nr:helix-turn-helix transcriptional regulator [Pseudomonas sp. B21-040]UVL39710.1 helix-turn-helix transcriptional regulator [Pseudomonas sp. B21-040]
MEHREALGQVLREIRVASGLNREDCASAVSRDYLASVERGTQSISVEKLRSLCGCFGIKPSLVIFAAEARSAGVNLQEYQTGFDRQFKEYILAGKLRSEPDYAASKGVRGKRTETNRKAIQSLQSQGFTKAEIARKLGVGSTTVDRHWGSGNDDV